MKDLKVIHSCYGSHYYTRAKWQKGDIVVTGQWVYADPYFRIVLDEDGVDEITGERIIREFDVWNSNLEFNGFTLIKEKK